MSDNKKPILKDTLAEEFEIEMERRLKTAAFVRALYPELDIVEAAALLRDPDFLFKMIGILENFEDESVTVEDLARIKLFFEGEGVEEEE
jgi:hypothetical protein